MPPVTGTATYNKKQGTLVVSSDGKITSFTADGETKPSKQIDVANITGRLGLSGTPLLTYITR